MKIAVFGGSFDPIHTGHIQLIKQLQEIYSFDKIMLMPAKNPPHKQNRELSSESDRLEMCRLASAPFDFIEVSKLEMQLQGISYTVNTIKELKRKYIDAELYLIMGSDMFLSFDTWYRWQDILDKAVLVCAARTEGDICKIEEKKKQFKDFHERIHVEHIPIIDISSSQIRNMIKSEKPVSEYLDINVLDYINRNGLYK